MALADGYVDLRLSDAEFRLFSELVRAQCGLQFATDTRFLLEKRIVRRMRELEIPSFSAYHHRLRSASPGDDEFARLVDELVTNETYFLRERRQLRALVHEILPEILLERRARGGGPVSVWSAGCSSGEEPYSIVILAREAGIDLDGDLRVYASDISRRVLRKARQGLYRPVSLRETEPYLREKYFTEKDGLFRIADEIKKHVDFIHLNLVDQSKIALLGAMDVVVCRNVIIYFDIETKRRVVETFYDKLRPGGHLLLGHSESLINLSTRLELRHLKQDLVYRRPHIGREAVDRWHAVASACAGEEEGEA